ncbi:methylenetetrahydrofolate dehydrogenase [Achromatium sp. WMS2]|nr:methylenetetrahydrofolate dehydrogenase [Achromatium sp. WMS2]
MSVLEPDIIAAQFRAAIRTELVTRNLSIKLVGFLASNDLASEAYARYTQTGCEDVGIHFELVKTDSNTIWSQLMAANDDPNVHGIFIYYPICGDARDTKLRNAVNFTKDVEGLTAYWLQKLYANVRFDDVAQIRKAILPCTPLAIIKILAQTSAYSHTVLPYAGKKITIFNRSEVVGKPLAYMLSHDGGTIYSFDIDGGIIIDGAHHTTHSIDRATALKQSDIVITGVPAPDFPKIQAKELKDHAICLNFSYLQNFTPQAKIQAQCYIPRVGPLTVAMCLRNALRLYNNYHQDQ